MSAGCAHRYEAMLEQTLHPEFWDLLRDEGPSLEGAAPEQGVLAVYCIHLGRCLLVQLHAQLSS